MQTTNLNTISRIKNNLRLHVRIVTSASDIIRTMKDESLNLVEYQVMESFEGITVVKSEQTLGVLGAAVACVTYDMFGDRIIYVDSFFEALSPDAQEFVLWHEVGHTKDAELVPAHLLVGQVRRRVSLLRGEVSREEAFADDYAASKMGSDRAVYALNELLLFSSSLKVLGTDAEVKLRIDRIQAGRRI